MKATTQEWVDKAEADYAAALMLRKSRKKYSRDIVCFHLQQCAEKYLKGRAEEGGIAIIKTHDLERLLDQVLHLEPMWNLLRPYLAQLKTTAVEVRYPGRTIAAAETNTLLKSTTHFRTLARQSLGLP